ncbi:MFS transporter [Spirillospora sp. NBC_01491]|uniref:MFS transporter n=1 Tax=Spirillospora sp. NBC_01491 TaxID=2976007 RepID=UPI002E303D06|nr:MFS transporter [Spirillospora sp. NBC_01491]
MSERPFPHHALPGPGTDGLTTNHATTGDPATDTPAGSGGRLALVLSTHHLTVSLGLYTVMPVLVLVLSSRAASAAGPGLFCYTASAGLGALLVSRWLSRRRYLPAMFAGTVLAAAGFGLLPYAAGTAGLLALLLVTGLGMSLHSLLSRVLVAETVADDIGRQRVYSTLMIAINVAASVGPFLAMLLYRGGDARPLFTVVAGCYLLAGAVLPLGVRAGLRTPAATTRWPIGRSTLRAALREATTRSTVLTTLAGTFMFAQFASALVLLLADEIASPAARAAFLAAPAVGVVLLQAPATALMTRLMSRGTPPYAFIGVASLGFGGTALLLGSGLPTVSAIVLAVALFTLAEPFFHSTVSTAFAGLPHGSRLETFNLRQVCWSTGEALGSLCGGTVYLLLRHGGHQRLYWLALGLGTLITIAPVVAGGARHRRHRQSLDLH